MKYDYSDIRNLTRKEPIWYDEHGCPRFVAFSPELCPDIYATIVVLMSIVCQNCQEKFLVELSKDHFTDIEKDQPATWVYKDPPFHLDMLGRSCIGNTMNSFEREVKECWVRKDNSKWERMHQYEVPIERQEWDGDL